MPTVIVENRGNREIHLVRRDSVYISALSLDERLRDQHLHHGRKEAEIALARARGGRLEDAALVRVEAGGILFVEDDPNLARDIIALIPRLRELGCSVEVEP